MASINEIRAVLHAANGKLSEASSHTEVVIACIGQARDAIAQVMPEGGTQLLMESIVLLRDAQELARNIRRMLADAKDKNDDFSGRLAG